MQYKIILALALLLGMLTVSTVSAQLGYYCLGDNQFYNWTEDGAVHNTTLPCLHGCSGGLCTDETRDSGVNTAVILGIALVTFVMFYFAMKLDSEKHAAIQLLFLGLGLIFLISDVALIQAMARLSGLETIAGGLDGPYIIFLTGFFLFLVYCVINLFQDVGEWLDVRKRNKGR